MSDLIFFDRAKQALIEAKSIDEVKDIRDKTESIDGNRSISLRIKLNRRELSCL